MKGEFKQECNRTACSNADAVFYNHSTRKYYCGTCATLINKVNRADAMRMFGHDLCILEDGQEYTATLHQQEKKNPSA